MAATWVRGWIGCNGAIQNFSWGRKKSRQSCFYWCVCVWLCLLQHWCLVAAVISCQPSGKSYLLDFFLPQTLCRLSTHLNLQLWRWEWQPYLAKCSSVFPQELQHAEEVQTEVILSFPHTMYPSLNSILSTLPFLLLSFFPSTSQA